MEHGRSLRNVPESHGKSWKVVEYSGIPWNMVEHCGMFWNKPIEQDGRLEKVMEPSGTTPWNFMEPDKNNGESSGKSWKVMEPSGAGP